MGISFHSSQSTNPHKMVAAQVMKLLWAASLAVAAPQLDFGDQRSVQRQVTTTSVSNNNINQDQVVTQVVGVLQPQIARAVAEALAAYSASTSSVSSSSSSSTGFASGSSRNSGEDVNARAEYNFEYKVADEAEQTYISQHRQTRWIPFYQLSQQSYVFCWNSFWKQIQDFLQFFFIIFLPGPECPDCPDHLGPPATDQLCSPVCPRQQLQCLQKHSPAGGSKNQFLIRKIQQHWQWRC